MFRAFLFLLLFGGCVSSFAASPPPLLVLGDSLSAGYGLSPRDGWVTLLEQRLQQSQPVRVVVNASISGETSAGGLARLPALIAEHKPALVIVELGANDGLRGLPLAEIHANLAKILTAIQASKARALLVGIELPVNYGPQYRDGLRTMYRGLAAEFNVPLLPFLLDGVALDPALMQDDGLHPKAAGEPRVLQNVWAVLAPILGTVPVQR
ncbi:MAG: arylesterase [Dokdonella sp.]